ncbi:MAG: DUF1501 domain-containing protein [Planctomycetaceae bacterium]
MSAGGFDREQAAPGWTRREWVRAGGLAPLGLGLPALLRAESAARLAQPAHGANLQAPKAAAGPRRQAGGGRGFGRARSCIVLFMFGAPAHQDLWDLKPAAPDHIRGEFQPIASSVPDVRVGELLPRLAERAHQLVQVRSVTHADNTHTVAMHHMLTGTRHVRPATNPQNAPDDFPCPGAVVRRLEREAALASGAGAVAGGLPGAIRLNAPANQVSANNHIFPGFFAGFLGSGFDPLFVSQSPVAAGFAPLPEVPDRARLQARRGLWERLGSGADRLEATPGVSRLSGDYLRAFELLSANEAREAFDLSREPDRVRAEYGLTPFGQGCLLARRLVERQVRLVTVNWERDDAYWDTHAKNFSSLRQSLCPNLDRGFPALLDDLATRGLLDETLVVWLGEFGRTPQINANAGRDHWAACNTVVLAGAGLPGGTVYGSSDPWAAYPATRPVTPDDLTATIYHLLGIDSRQSLLDPLGRPHQLCHGEPLWDLL